MESTSDLRAIKEQLLVENLRFVKLLVGKVINTYHWPVDYFDDGYSVGVLALVKKIDEFDINSGRDFKAFAYKRVIGAIKDHFRCLNSLNGYGMQDKEKSKFYEKEYLTLRAEYSTDGKSFYDGTSPEKIILDSEAVQMVGKFAQGLHGIERRIVKLHYFKGKSFKEIAQKLKKHPSYVSRIHSKVVNDLRNSFLYGDINMSVAA